jgi:hypothetical protein
MQTPQLEEICSSAIIRRTIRDAMPKLCPKFHLLLAIVSACSATQPVQLTPQPQKFRTFYALNDPQVPAQLNEPAAPLPVGGVSAIAAASDGAFWYGTAQGLVRIDRRAPPRDRIQYFAGTRYLPDDAVQQLFADKAAGLWVRTHTGVSHIELRPMTLAAKAAMFEERIRKRHDRHGLVSPSDLETPGDLSTSHTRDDDNDGLWTAMYAAAECFRYAVTKSPESLANARKATQAVLFLEEIAGKRGFPARSYIRKGEPMPHDGQWHWTADGEYYWKGDTSSDEIVGHFFLYSIATDLLPDVALKKSISETTTRIMNHIIDHGYYLVDVTGKPTTWGRWAPEYFRTEPGDSPLNSLELVSFLKSAAHITGNPKYDAEYQKVAMDMGYAQLTTRNRELREEINYSDEELAMLSFYCLFRYEKDAGMLERYYRPALNQWWENERREENPLWTFIYATAKPSLAADFASAARTLYRMPMDTVDWSVRNSQRQDVVMDRARDRFEHAQAKTLLPPDERPVMKWNANPFEIDSNAAGRSEDDGTAFLLPYWMGRHYRFLVGE